MTITRQSPPAGCSPCPLAGVRGVASSVLSGAPSRPAGTGFFGRLGRSGTTRRCNGVPNMFGFGPCTTYWTSYSAASVRDKKIDQETKEIKLDPAKVETVKEWSTPAGVKETQVFLGFANFYRRFIRDYSSIVSPLTALTRKEDGSSGKNHRKRHSRHSRKHSYAARHSMNSLTLCSRSQRFPRPLRLPHGLGTRLSGK